MKPKLTILLAVIVIAPLVILVWLGVKIGRDEREMVRVRVSQLLMSRLSDLSESIGRIMESQERELVRITELTSYDPDTLRRIVRNERIVRQMFVLDSNGKLEHPIADEQASASEKQFLTRTGRIFEEKGVFIKATDDHVSTKTSAKAGAEKVKRYGWHVWYWDEGINLIFWRRHASGRVVGAEVSRIVLLSDIVSALPDTRGDDDGDMTRIELRDASGRSVYGFGPHRPAGDEKPSVRLVLAPPLGSWELVCFSSPRGLGDAFGGSLVFNLLTGIGLLAFVVTALAFYFIRENNREIREARLRVTFVNQVSHELKTPLTNIRMYAELLEDHIEEEKETPRSYLSVIVAESQRLSRLIGNVLTFGRQQQSQLTLRAGPGVVDHVISQVLAQFEPSLTLKGIEISFDGKAAGEVLVDTDALEQILGNLLSNVEKYAASGRLVEIESFAEGDNTIITIADRGPGIPKTAEQKIFDPFFRQTKSLTEGVSGTGIGLGISRDLARLHGGDVTLEPRQVGTLFRVVLHTPQKGSDKA